MVAARFLDPEGRLGVVIVANFQGAICLLKWRARGGVQAGRGEGLCLDGGPGVVFTRFTLIHLGQKSNCTPSFGNCGTFWLGCFHRFFQTVSVTEGGCDAKIQSTLEVASCQCSMHHYYDHDGVGGGGGA
jgi:hypothetical protein